MVRVCNLVEVNVFTVLFLPKGVFKTSLMHVFKQNKQSARK